MYGLFAIVYCVVMFVLLFFAASKMRDLVQQKGYDPIELHIFAWCFWFPIFGYLYVIALPNLTLQKQNAEIIQLLNNQST